MNILIVGNGFDLSHYLPTKYDHFMVAMDAIENWNESKGDMGFDDIFGSLYEKEDYFFGYTKAIYKTDDIKISVDQIKKLKKQLKENVWYQYFSDHVREVKTWIDFETKIKNALEIVFDFYNQILEVKSKGNEFFRKIETFSKYNSQQALILRGDSSNILNLLDLLDVTYFKNNRDNVYGELVSEETTEDDLWDSCDFSLNESFIYKSRYYEDYDFQKVVTHLQSNLENFIDLFNSYLMTVEKLEAKVNLEKKGELSFLNEVDKVYSFNYTDTNNKLYNIKRCEFLHGKVGVNQNIVMGVSDLDEKFLSKFNLYGFTKYHQKLFKYTDYRFLFDKISENKKQLLNIQETKKIYYSAISGSNSYLSNIYDKQIQHDQKKLDLGLSIYIWGHSLDVSDENYIRETFSFDEENNQNILIQIFYFNKNAYSDLLSNLFRILGKEKVELWMKKDWLKFEKNPDIAEINGIKPIDLPKT